MVGKRKTARREDDTAPSQPDELKIHGPWDWGIDWKGASVRKWSALIVAALLALAILALLSWLAVSFPGVMIKKQDLALNKGAQIELALGEVKKTEAKHHHQVEIRMAKMDEALETQTEILQEMQAKLQADAGERPKLAANP